MQSALPPPGSGTSCVLSGQWNAGQWPESHCMQGTEALEQCFIVNPHSTFWQKEPETEFYIKKKQNKTEQYFMATYFANYF